MKLRSMIKAHYTISLYLFHLTTQPTGKKMPATTVFSRKNHLQKAPNTQSFIFFFLMLFL